MTAVHGVDDLLVLDLPARLDWHEQALCAQTDPELWFPEKGGTLRPAKDICNRCPVVDQCLAWALEHDVYFGVYGGKSALERRRLIKERENGTPA